MEKFSIQSEVKPLKGDVKENVFVVTESGRIDSETAPAFDAELTKAVGINSWVVIDFKDVEYMSSAGLRAVVKASQAAAKAGGTVVLASVPEAINSVVYTVGLDLKITAYANVDDAMASFG